MPLAFPRKRPVRRRPKLDHPNPIDAHVGSRVRLRRILLGMSQEKLGTAIGLTFQQVQKYERGTNRIGASRLWELSTVLGVPVQFFFGEMTTETLEQMSRITEREVITDGDGTTTVSSSPTIRPETLELMRAFDRIPVVSVRQRMVELAKAVATEFSRSPVAEEAG